MHIFNLVLFWTFFGFWASYLARKKGKNPTTWFLLGIFLGIIGVLLIFLLPPKRVSQPASKVEIVVKPVPQPLPEWHFFDKNKIQKGPISLVELKAQWKSGEINENSFVWASGMENWKTVKDLPEILSELTS